MSTIPSYLDYSSVPNDFFVKTKRADGSDPYANERNLFSSWACESINKHGVTLSYFVITFDVNAEKLFGEDNTRRVQRRFDFMASYQLPKEDRLFTKFGIEGMDQITAIVSKKHFNTASQYDFALEDPQAYPPYNPKVGDIVKSQYNDMYYEIEEVKEEDGQMLLSKQHVWSLYLRPFRNEHFDLSATTSAGMSDIAAIINTDDPFDIKSYITSAAPPVNYTPEPTEKADDSFWS